ncbi:MAG TPA: coproporphyrinogen dehydrogenase HemZ [Bacillota bacterium]|nr:coproporphyrinogen dehydrogenase HemZ [Bacillota bacterium]HPZ60055.1 coproporphyrinogen dehydrogenase HemZ [Bacillota bacterium]
MYKIYFNRVKQVYELGELVRMFLPPSEFSILEEDPLGQPLEEEGDIVIRLPDSITTRDDGKRYLYDQLKKYTGRSLEWGTLTGVRPVKLVGDLLAAGNTPEQVLECLEEQYYLSREKAELLMSIRKTQLPYLNTEAAGAIGVYIGIPFCPTRCIYCSFTSNQVSYEKVLPYLDALEQEIRFAGEAVTKQGWYPESVYIGGGTPTTLKDQDMEKLLKTVRTSFDFERVKEFTVEAGRPDTITESKLAVLKENGVDRICINPQSMNQETLDRIGRLHRSEDVAEAFRTAQKIGFKVINADLIAGLPGEEPEDFLYSLKSIIDLKPDNITVHTLAVKRASRLKEIDEHYSYRQGEKVRLMLNSGQQILRDAGYVPYYLYRQKQMAGNLENVGYCFPGKESLYNIRIMEENQTILALGAGGISKVWYPDENRLERIPNVSNYEIYIERIEEMIQRKKDGIFTGFKEERQ